jgi:hypothetical protein
MANDESARRAEDGCLAIQDALQTAQEELAAERLARRQAEQERDEAIASRREVVERLQAATPAVEVPKPFAKAVAGKRSGSGNDRLNAPVASVAAKQQQPRRGGRPPKVKESDAEFVEWWKHGWQEKYR